ncbi:DUF1835 domain-containing protein [Altibacter sp. HG106]|uniref:DUF1835 domain-containing protein n=1 Tax=Altibacter sp. HG106 TaxID=3023937 RepID=UPI0023504830|nr:DUF1835 domain-containing protein [Altibacter sp. HG106]MDC7995671.1 DUF1835 domain-containing protein [Altibacter sp. HG106]
MKTEYHILNGDALKEQFPKPLKGIIYVARECLVDGPVQADTDQDFFRFRAQFIEQAYDLDEAAYYARKSVIEFEKIQQIPSEATVHLWFEDDLFCQVNMWFVCHLLWKSSKDRTIYLIRPEEHRIYGFGHMDEKALITAYDHKTLLPTLKTFSALWKAYQHNDKEQLLALAATLQTNFPQVAAAVQAHLDRSPDHSGLGKPERIIKEIMNGQETNQFGPIFREFCRRAPEYGFGDLQVKKLWERLKST